MKTSSRRLKVLVCIAVFIAVIGAIKLAVSYASPNAPLSSDECRLNFAAVSDLHIDSEENNKTEAIFADIIYSIILPDMEKAKEKLDAVILAGDTTDNGYNSQWAQTAKILSEYDIADEIILAAGNHDLWTRGMDGKTSKELFTEYNKIISDREVTDLYYSTEINGYTFIVISGETDSIDASFSDKQIEWLKAEMEKAAEKDLPVFVICHWPLNKTHGLPVTWGDDEYDDMTGGIGEQSDEIEAILKKHDKVFLISGHIHTGFSNADDMAETGYQTIESDGSFHSINLPRVGWIANIGHVMPGTGYNVEVYDDEVVFRARNYIFGTWLPKYDYTIALV